jgi:hypothetical protein
VQSIGKKGNDGGDEEQGVKDKVACRLPPKPPNQVMMIPKMTMMTRRRERVSKSLSQG